MKHLIIILLMVSQQVFGQTPFTIQNNIESRPEIGISFPLASNEELKTYIPKYKSKTIEYFDTTDGVISKKSYEVAPPPINSVKRRLQYSVPLEKAKEKNGIKFLRVRILSKNADELSLMLKRTRLKSGESIFFYSADKKWISQSYTQYNINDYGTMSSPFIKTDEMIMEYNSTNFNEIGNIEIASISHFFPEDKDATSKLSIQPRSGNCLWDVNCSQFDDCCNQIRSVVHLMQSNNGLCSGALINNPKNDGTHLILTAQHCTDEFEPTNVNVLWAVPVVGAILDWFFDVEVNIPIPIDRDRDPDFDLTELRVIYNYQSPSCINDDMNNQGIKDMVSTGVDWVEYSGYFLPPFNWSNDISIIKMNRKPEYQWNVYYAGWTNETDRGNFEFNRVESISHPSSKDKKYAKGTLNLTPLPAMWYVSWNQGVILGGSSGSPLFNNRKEIIGPLSGGLANCNNFNWSRDVIGANLVFNTSFYGKLGMWADFDDIVCGHDQFSCGGYDPILACKPHIDLNDNFWSPSLWRAAKPSIKIQAANTINVSTDKDVLFRENAEYKIVAGDEISIKDETGNSEVFNGSKKYKTELEFYTAPCEWTEEQCGFNYFKMANSNQSTNNLVEKEKNVFDLTLHPNPTSQNSTLTLIGYSNRKADILVLDQSGRIIFKKNISNVENEKAEVEIESKNWSKGMYIIRVASQESTKAIKLVKE
jgi:hypothetical protein